MDVGIGGDRMEEIASIARYHGTDVAGRISRTE